MGYAFDGFGIFGYYGEDGSELTNADLDECHGHTHVIGGMVKWRCIITMRLTNSHTRLDVSKARPRPRVVGGGGAEWTEPAREHQQG
ncbi:MAG: hypothetical protein U0X87_10785 [Anaerolineales bacterium]